MTIKKRLFISNILMIVVPVLAALAAGGCCIVLLWLMLQGGGGLPLEDSGDFSWASRAVVKLVSRSLTEEKPLDALGETLQANGLRVSVLSGGETVYTWGEEQPDDTRLLQAAESLSGTRALVSAGENSLFVAHREINGTQYQIRVYGTRSEELSSGMKLVIVLAGLILLCAVLAAIWGTNRFLVRFVFKRINDPLTVLSDGVREIGNGNLDYRIDYHENKLHISAVCDVKPEAMETLLAKHGLEGDTSIKRYTDYRKMLAKNELELAAIATESGLHARIALDCIDAGVNVIIEKPMAMSMTDAEEIIRRSRDRGVKVCACHQNRFNTAVQETRRALEDGRFGKLSHGSVHVRWNRNRDYYDQAPWRGTWAQDGGCLMNQCIHGIDLLRWMMGEEVEEVYGVTRQQFHDYLECEDVGMAVVKFKNGAIGTVEGTTNVYPQNLEETLYLFGEHGTVKLGGKSTNHIDVWDFADVRETDEKNKGLQEVTSNVYGNGHTALYADMIDAIRQNRAP